MFDSAVTNWAIFGLILSILELFVPGVYLIWFGFAAFVVSLLVNLFGIAFTAQMIWFAILSVIFAVLGLYKQMKSLLRPRKKYCVSLFV